MSKKTLAANPKVQTLIKDVKSKHNQGILLVNQKTMQDIYKKSGPLAASNEFQTHFWSVNYRYTGTDGAILDIAIPTVHFNYKQSVNASAVDFDLKEVSEVSEKLQPIHNIMANKLQALGVKAALESLIGVELEQWDVPMNSIHRHPGSLHSFSGTDLCKTPTEPGVVYPLAKPIANQPNFAGIMTIHGNTCKVGHYEYRIANGELGKDIKYTEGRCAAIMVGPMSKVSTVEALLGIQPTSSSYAKYVNCERSPIIDAIHKLGENLYLSNNFEAHTEAVVEANVEKQVITTYANIYNGGYGHTYDFTAQYENYNHKYKPKQVINKMGLFEANELYKKLYYQKHKKLNHTWISSLSQARSKVTKLQQQLGCTAEQPYGKTGFKFRTEDQYSDMYFPALKEEYKAICEAFNEEQPTYLHTYTFNKLMSDILKMKAKHDKTEVNTDTVETAKNDLQTILDAYKDVTFVDTDKGTTKEEAIEKILELEAIYYANSPGIKSTEKELIEEFDALVIQHLEDLQDWVKEEITQAEIALTETDSVNNKASVACLSALMMKNRLAAVASNVEGS